MDNQSFYTPDYNEIGPWIYYRFMADCLGGSIGFGNTQYCVETYFGPSYAAGNYIDSWTIYVCNQCRAVNFNVKVCNRISD